jgi:hypothetical protein
MKEHEPDAPFVEEMGGPPVSADPPAAIAAPVEEPFSAAPVEDKSARWESEIRFLRERLEQSQANADDLARQVRRLAAALCVLAVAGGFAGCKIWGRAANNSADVEKIAGQISSLKPAGPPAAATFFYWEQGQPPVRLIRRGEGFCVLTKVSGRFQGGGESVRLWIDGDGWWYLGGESHQLGVNAECAVFKY